jgi:hypothetical protein
MQNMLLCKPCGQYTNAQHFLQDTVWLQVYQNCNRLLQLLTPSGLDSSALYHRLHCQHLNLTTLVSVNFRHILTSKLYHGNVKKLISLNTMLRTIKSYVKKGKYQMLLVVELILHGAHHGTVLPLMLSSWKNIVVPKRWDAAFERSLNMDSTRHSHSYKFS